MASNGSWTRRRVLAGGAGLGFASLTGACASRRAPELQGFAALRGWETDDHAAGLRAFRLGCGRVRGPMGLDMPPGWGDCGLRESARAYFEEHFVPVRLSREEGLFTGYYEPELFGSRTRFGPYQTPLHAKPRSRRGLPPRAKIARGALDGQGLELFWVADPVEAFFLEIQGSGRIRLAEGGIARVGFAGQNGHPYYAIGRALVEDGVATPDQITADTLKSYLRANPTRARQLMDRNPSYVFFREVTDLNPADGPVGAMSVPLTAGRSLAVDRQYHGLGLPVWIETESAGRPFRRLMVAQDTGGAIKGPGRADIFFGTGPSAGALASAQRAHGRMWTLVPRALAPRIRPV